MIISINGITVNIDLRIMISIISIAIGIIAGRRQIRGLIYKLFEINPLDIQYEQFHVLHNSLIRDPINETYYLHYKNKNLVFHTHDSFSISITNLIDRTLRISPVIKIKIIKYEKIKDLPVILFPEPQPYGMGGGGESDHFSVTLTINNPNVDATFINVTNQKKYDYYDVSQNGLEDFILEVNYQPGYYFSYQIGIEYRKNNKTYIQWIPNDFWGGAPWVMRIWYYRQMSLNKTLLIETDQLYYSKYEDFYSYGK